MADGKKERGPREHDVKCWPGPFQAMLDGRKRFEWRKDDRGYSEGDVLRVREWGPDAASVECSRAMGYTGRSFRVTITYVLRGRFGVPDGYAVLGTGEPRNFTYPRPPASETGGTG